jgi:predicted dehydrogenase
MNQVRWGVLSTANIGTKQVIPAMQQGKLIQVTAIASRSLDKAEQEAKALRIPKAYGSYEELLADPEVDAVYNPLPNHLHVPWSINALEAGKHVLCEKPISLTAPEGQKLLEVASQYPELKVMEAFMYRHHPQWQEAKGLVQAGELGELKTIHTVFSYFNDDPDNIRNMADIGGGGLMDIGCYPISVARFIFDAEPLRTIGIIERDPSFNTDRITSAIMEFEKGVSTFTCSTQLADYQRVTILGTDGWIEIEIPFNAPVDRPCKIWQKTGDEFKQIELEIGNQYTIQGDLFSQAILDDTAVPTPIEDAIANMRVIDAVFKSAETGKWIDI